MVIVVAEVVTVSFDEAEVAKACVNEECEEEAFKQPKEG